MNAVSRREQTKKTSDFQMHYSPLDQGWFGERAASDLPPEVFYLLLP
jgi:hypothetical protein